MGEDRTIEEFKEMTDDINAPMDEVARIIVETDEENSELLAVVTQDDCETAPGLRVRMKPVYGDPAITIKGKRYEVINIRTKKGELIASISAENIIHENGYRVDMIPGGDGK